MNRASPILLTILLLSSCVTSRTATPPSPQPSSTLPSPSSSQEEVVSTSPTPTQSLENIPTVLTSNSKELSVNPNKKFIKEGLEVEILGVQILSSGIGILIKVKNISDKPVSFLPRLSTVVFGSQQLEYDNVIYGEFSSEIYPGVEQEGRLIYIPVGSYTTLNPQQNDSLTWIIDINLESVSTALPLVR